MQNLADLILGAYPKAKDCVGGHKGPAVKTWDSELADDRAYLLVVSRCEHCGMPLGEDYADEAEQQRYREGKKPC